MKIIRQSLKQTSQLPTTSSFKAKVMQRALEIYCTTLVNK